MKEIIQAIKNLAQSKYNESHGWQVIVETFTDKEIWEHLEHMKELTEDQSPITLEWAIEEFTEYASIQTERYEEIQSTIW